MSYSKRLHIPLSVGVCDEAPESSNSKCYDCLDKIRAPFIRVMIESGVYRYHCKKCAFAAIERYQASLQFAANDINSLKEHFPRKTKDKTDDINIAEHL